MIKINKNVLLWIWFQLSIGYSSHKSKRILASFDSIAELFKADDAELERSGMSQKQIGKLRSEELCREAGDIIETCNSHRLNIISPDMEEYPKRLLSLKDYPVVLYVDGDISFLNEKIAIGVVGSRHADNESIETAERLSAALARSDIAIISGGALGIDSAAHMGAICAGGKTVAVLGCGFLFNYLKVNKPLREKISKNGAVVSEYPPKTPSAPYQFSNRNRIISGLSNGVVVVEAGEGSGSLVTANYAMLQGREVFAIPGSTINKDYIGTNKLIQNGANPVFSPFDVLSVLVEKKICNVDLDGIPKYMPTLIESTGNPDIALSVNVKTDGNKTLVTFFKDGKTYSDCSDTEKNTIPEKKKVPTETDIHSVGTKMSDKLNKENIEESKGEFKPITEGCSPSAAAIYEILKEKPMHPNEIFSSLDGTVPMHKIMASLTELSMYGLVQEKAGRMYNAKREQTI